MVSWIISRLVVLIFGTLYPAYYSYKAVKSKDIKEYVKWMMYWIIFALFTTAETFTDIFLCWFPFYYELKIAFVAWLLSPYTKGSSLLYRKFVHPTLSSKEKEIDDCLVQAKDRSYDALVHFGKRGLNVAATAAVMAASKVARLFHLVSSVDLREGQVTLLRDVTNSKQIQSGGEASSPLHLPAHGLDPSQGQGALSERLRSFSMQDLTTIRGDGAPAPSSTPTPGSGRATGKHGQPKMSRSASESASSSVCTCCSTCRTRKVVEGDVNEGGVKAWDPHQVQNPLAFSDEEEEDLLDFMYKYKALRRTEIPLEAPPRVLRSRFRKKSTSSSATETTECLRCASEASKHNSSRTSLFQQDDGPSSSDRCLAKTPEMLSMRRQYCNDREECNEARGAAQNKKNHKTLVSPWILD
ncbi:receptor expression-enhancing protein 1 isoform X1 [Mustela putorius furo]|uniref:Receptor expression-enhancing protein 1 isoform X1 n=1 Tax=Mustela putorius furo TaxID=9669 RepID=A0A8U0NP27_MUSPF|nr:receptor expression-enhancing protein 1 isoform X1 [Mustela putorius furo]